MFTYSSLVIVVSSEPLRHLRGIRQLRRHVFTVRSHTLVLSRSLGEMLIYSTAMGDQNRWLTEMSAVVTVVILLGSKRFWCIRDRSRRTVYQTCARDECAPRRSARV